MDNINWADVVGAATPDNSRVSYNDNKHLFTKIAFDVFQLNSSPVEAYWRLEKGEEGADFLVATYDVDSTSEGLEVTSGWNAITDKTASNVTLFYKGAPIKRFASNDYGFGPDDVDAFNTALVNKLTSEASFVDKLLDVLPQEKKIALAQTFPELAGEQSEDEV